jgi:hypothetical protein
MLDVNTPAASEHVGDIERRIRLIKERARGIVCTLPYSRLPWIMLIHLLHFIMMWLNNFPVTNGVSADHSPREIILRHCLSYKYHCRAPFGAYCETHEDNEPTNSIHSHALPTICQGPTGKFQGSYHFLNLLTGLVIKWRAFIELLAPQSVIDHVTTLALKLGVPRELSLLTAIASRSVGQLPTTTEQLKQQRPWLPHTLISLLKYQGCYSNVISARLRPV